MGVAADPLSTKPDACASRLTTAVTVTDHFRSLALEDKLISQTDRRLLVRDLIVSNGGLCGITCGINALHAIARYQRLHGYHFESYADEFLQDMAVRVFAYYHSDVRRGIRDFELGYAIRTEAESLKVPLSVEIFNPVTPDVLVTKGDQIIIANINMGTTASGAELYHAVVIVHADPVKGTVIYSDPNSPAELRQTALYSMIDASGFPKTVIAVGTQNSTQPAGTIASILRITSRMAH